MNLPGRQQWGNRDGYCGSMSIQSAALYYGNWISQDMVRHSVGNKEILHTNIAAAISQLRFGVDAWQYTQYSIPQWQPYLQWMKKSLANGWPVMWFIYCKGDSHGPHDGGYYDHIEPVFGVWSNYSLTDDNYYGEDVLVHNSDYDGNHYYRSFDSLPDTAAMDGNCANAQPGVGNNEMYPCIPSDNYNYGFAISGLVDPDMIVLPSQLSISSSSEPDLDNGAPPVNFTGILNATSLTPGQAYIIYRYDDENKCPGCKGTVWYQPSIPTNSDYANSDFDFTHKFTADSTSYVFKDPVCFVSLLSLFIFKVIVCLSK